MKYHTFPSDQILQIFGQYTLIQTNTYILIKLKFIFCSSLHIHFIRSSFDSMYIMNHN